MAKDYARNTRSSRRRAAEDSGRNWRWPLAGILILLFTVGIFYLKQQSDKLAAEQGDQGGSFIQETLKQNSPDNTITQPTSTSKKLAKTKHPAVSATTTPTAAPQPKFDFYTTLPNGQVAESAMSKTTNPPPPVISAPEPVITTTTASTPLQTTAPPPPPAALATTGPPAPATSATIMTKTKSASANKQSSKKASASKVQTDSSDLIAIEIEKLSSDKPVAKAKVKADTNTATHYTLQLASFKNFNDADQLKAQLLLQGYEVSIKNSKKGNTDLYQVVMGSYPTITAAKKQQIELAGNQIKSKVVTK